MGDTEVESRISTSNLQKPTAEEITNDENDTRAESPEFLVKHPLQNKWTLWFYKNDRSRTWEDNQLSIITFDTVEDFWALYNHIELASKLASGCDYSLFKEGIRPMWEDESNKYGGRWVINLDKKQRNTCLDTFWLEVMLLLIGESFEDDSQIVNGAVVSVRQKGDKIGMWLGKNDAGPSILSIGKKVKERLRIDSAVTLGFEAHHDTMKKSGSTARNKFIV